MLPVGRATKVTIYLNTDTGSKHGFLRDEILSSLQAEGVGAGGATVLHPYAGFRLTRTAARDRRRRCIGLHLPVVIFFVEATERVKAMMPALLEMVTDGLVEAHPIEIYKNVAEQKGY